MNVCRNNLFNAPNDRWKEVVLDVVNAAKRRIDRFEMKKCNHTYRAEQAVSRQRPYFVPKSILKHATFCNHNFRL